MSVRGIYLIDRCVFPSTYLSIVIVITMKFTSQLYRSANDICDLLSPIGSHGADWKSVISETDTNYMVLLSNYRAFFHTSNPSNFLVLVFYFNWVVVAAKARTLYLIGNIVLIYSYWLGVLYYFKLWMLNFIYW